MDVHPEATLPNKGKKRGWQGLGQTFIWIRIYKFLEPLEHTMLPSMTKPKFKDR